MAAILEEVRHAFRLLARSPGFTATCLAMLALGIGANTAIFSVIDAVLLRPLAFPRPEQLVRVTADLRTRGVTDIGVDAPTLFDYAQQTDLFEGVSGLCPINVNLTGGSEPERLEGLLVSAGHFQVLGAQPRLGRVFDQRDYRPGIAEVAVISDALWKRLFGADPHIIGRAIRLDNDLYTIVGVLPPGFRHPSRGLRGEIDLWAPSGYRAAPFTSARSGFFLSGVLARLKPGVSVATAQARLDAFGAALRRKHPEAYEKFGWTPRVIPLRNDLAGKAGPPLLLLAAAVGMVLLIACANVANLLLARAAARQRDLAIRCALGASTGRLLRQLLVESLVLSVAAGLLGFAIAPWSITALLALAPADVPRMAEVAVDARVLGFSLLVSVVTGLVFGLAPARFVARTDPNDVLKEAARGATSGTHTHRLRHALVIAEFALALVLLIGASLLLRSFARLYAIDPGFDPAQVTTARLQLPQPNDLSTGPYLSHPQRLPFYRESIRRIEALPGVEAAGWVSRLPLDGLARAVPFAIEGRPLESAESMGTEIIPASPGCFRAFRIPLVSGRLFTDHDTPNAPLVILINELFARRYFPGEDPIGRRVRPGGATSTVPWLTIVGVVRDIQSASLDREAVPQMYRCLWQTSALSMALVVRGRLDAATAAQVLSREVRAIDPELPLFSVKPMTSVLAEHTSQRRFAMVLLGIFAATALGLAALGIYALMAYLVRLRSREIGIRMALGARPSDAVSLVLRRGLVLTLAAAFAGLAAAALLSRLISGMLFGVSPFDPLSFAAPSVMLLLVALAACYVPARRAARVDPARTLASE